MVARPLIAVTSLVFTAGAILLIFLVLLGGAVTGSPEDQIYFLRVDTSGIKGAPKTTDWTFWNYCDGSSGYNADCTSVAAAYPFDPPRNFGGTDGIPDAFIGTHEFYYLSRFFFAFTLIGLFFAVLSLFLGLSAACFRIGGVFSGLATGFALFWQTAGSALMTCVPFPTIQSEGDTADGVTVLVPAS
ncbi:MAG: hypothetical protein M1838_005282 [Thelocarpon superellum]|nr:MAG: hypothetical protein M1838_005282 [Thelocarpon superellum]